MGEEGGGGGGALKMAWEITGTVAERGAWAHGEFTVIHLLHSLKRPLGR